MPTYPILFIPTKPRILRYKGKGFGKKNFPPRDRLSYGKYIAQLLEAAWKQNSIANAQKDIGTLPAKKGIYLEVRGAAQHDLAIESLDSSGMRLLHVNTIQDAEIAATVATVFIPEEKNPQFVKKIQEYTSGELTRYGKPQNDALMRGIEDIYTANLASFWTDAPEDIPQNTPVWCAVWLDGNDEHIFQDFVDKAEQLGIECSTSQACTAR